MGTNPATCTEEASPNYTIGTFDLYVQPSGATSETLVGNIQTGGFQFTPTIVEHRRGKDNSLDALFKIGSDYIINGTLDELNPFNLAMILNEDYVTVGGGCRINLTGGRCVKTYYARLEHTFPCKTKALSVVFWRAQILADTTVTFDPATPSNFPVVVKSLSCESQHPTNPFGYLFISEACPLS